MHTENHPLDRFDADDMLTTREVALTLGVTIATVRRWIKRDGLPAMMHGYSGWFVQVRDLRKHLCEHGLDGLIRRRAIVAGQNRDNRGRFTSAA
jgi:excisionase family DNA binding protein